MSTQNYHSCPRGCGWSTASPDLDEDGNPYTCYLCCNTGQVSTATLHSYSKAVARQTEDDSFSSFYLRQSSPS